MTNDKKMKEIEKEMEAEMLSFKNSVYEGIVPKGLLKYYTKAYMHIPPAVHKTFVGSIKKIIKKKEEELTNDEVSHIVNFISGCEPAKIYATIDEAFKFNEALDNFRVENNLKVAAKQRQFDEIKASKVAARGIHLGERRILTN